MRQIERDGRTKTRVHMNYMQMIRVRGRIHRAGAIKIIINMCEYLYVETIMRLITSVYDRASTRARGRGERDGEKERKRLVK